MNMAVGQNENINSTSACYWDYLVKNPDSIKKKIAIVYAGRSGSMMLSGLLEGHSHLLSFNCYCDARLYSTLKEFVSQGNVTINSFKHCLSSYFDSILDLFYKHPLLPAEIRPSTDRTDTHSFMLGIEEICNYVTDSQLNLNMMLNIVFIAYGKLRNRPLNTQHPTMIIQLHTPFFMDGWKYLFSNLNDTEVIVMVRNPIKALDSHFYHHIHELPSPPWNSFFERILVEFKKSLIPTCDLSIQNKTYCMFFEDIHSNTEKAMLALCKHLDIPYEPILLEETIDGNKAVFSTAGKNVSGTSKERAQNTSLKTLSTSDVHFIEYLFKDMIRDLGYKLSSNGIQRLLGNYFLTRLEYSLIKIEVSEHMKKKHISHETVWGKIKYLYYFICTWRQLYTLASSTHRRVSKMRVRKNELHYKINPIKSQ